MRMRSHVALTVAVLAGGTQPVAAQVTEYYHLDGIGNVRAVTDQSRTVIERHDYLPFGEECTTAPCQNPPQAGSGQPKRFTGKERDTETGLDYFGARYYGNRIGRFTTVDPAKASPTALADPQQWNRYAYARCNPLRYLDPKGAILELTGDDREEALTLLKGSVGGQGGSLLYTRTEGDRTFVEYRGKESDRLAASGINGVMLANLIDSPKTTEFRLVDGNFVLHTKYQTVALALKGGAATVGAEESLNGNIQVFVARTSAGYMNSLSMSLLGRGMSTDPTHPLYFSLPLIAAHELGHAESNLSGRRPIH